MKEVLLVLRKQMSEKTRLQFFKFLIFGGLAAVVNISSRFAFSKFSLLDYNTAITAAYILGMIINFSLNKVYTFPSSHNRTYLEVRKFVVIALMGLILTNLFALLFVYILKNIFFIQITNNSLEAYSHILAVGFVAIFSFLGHKYFTFKRYKKY